MPLSAPSCMCMYVCIPACSQIWAKVIQGCRGPCLGALLCRDEATSERACSTRLAAIDVAWTEPGGGENQTIRHGVPDRYWLTTTEALGSHVPRCRVLTQPNTTAGFTDSHNFSEKRGTVKSGVFGCRKKVLGLHWHMVSCSCTKAFNQSTPFHTLQHTVLWSWINQVKMN